MNPKKENTLLLKFIANTIRSIRQEQGYSQIRLAKELKLSRASIVNIEKSRQQPTAIILYKLSMFFNCSVSKFFPKDKKELNKKSFPQRVRVHLPDGTSTTVMSNSSGKLLKDLNSVVALTIEQHNKTHKK